MAYRVCQCLAESEKALFLDTIVQAKPVIRGAHEDLDAGTRARLAAMEADGVDEWHTFEEDRAQLRAKFAKLSDGDAGLGDGPIEQISRQLRPRCRRCPQPLQREMDNLHGLADHVVQGRRDALALVLLGLFPESADLLRLGRA
jgi:hypothetical protein